MTKYAVDKKWLMYLTMAIFGVGGINILLRILNIAYPMLDTVLVFLGFFGLLVIAYGVNNKFQFKSKMDLLLWAGIVAMVVFIGSFGGQYISATPPLIQSIYQGLLPLIYGFVVAGLISVVVGIVNLRK